METAIISKDPQHLQTKRKDKSSFFLGKQSSFTPRLFFQPKLKVGIPNDPYEREADAVADMVVHGKSFVQRKCSECADEGKNNFLTEPVEKNTIAIHRKGESSTSDTSAALEARLSESAGNGSPLATKSRSEMEDKFGTDFSQVNIHTDATAAGLSKQLNAKAFTIGNDIYFNSGEFSTETAHGKNLLAHELTHVVQQRNSTHVIQRAEVDDNPTFCFPLDDSPQLQDVSSTINAWIDVAAANAIQQNKPATEGIIDELAALADPLTTVVESRIASLPTNLVRQVTLEESRYNVNWLGRKYYKMKHKSPVAPVINLCGTCVGVDKIGHFFQQGGEYFHIGEAIRSTLPATMPAQVQDVFIENFTNEYGKYLEGMPNKLTYSDVLWLKRNNLIPMSYFEGIYGSKSSGVLSSADLEANKQGGRFLRDVMANPGQPVDICNYVNDNWNERFNPNTYGGTGMFTLKKVVQKDLSKVYFGTGSDTPDPAVIQAIAYNMSAHADQLKTGDYYIRFDGYASLLGKSEDNMELSDRRANAVKDQVEKALGTMINNAAFKFDEDKVKVEANGDFWADMDEEKTTNDDSPEDRVVEIIFKTF